MMEELLLNLVRQIAFIPTEELQAHVDACRSSIARAHSVGAILDPTAYRDALQNHGFENSGRQLKMAEHILGIRKLIDEHETMRQEYLAKRGKA
jgi:hypothetical protein